MRVAGIHLGVGQNTLNSNVILFAQFLTNFADSSSFDRTFTAEFGEPAIVDSALFLHDDILSTTDVTDLDLLSSDFTIEFYAKVTSHTAALRGLFGISDATFTKGFRVYLDSSNRVLFQCRIVGVGGISTIATPSSFPTSSRTKVAIVKDGGVVKMLINDTLVASQNFGTTLVSYTSETAFKIGALVGLSPHQYAKNTFIDNLKITKQALY